MQVPLYRSIWYLLGLISGFQIEQPRRDCRTLKKGLVAPAGCQTQTKAGLCMLYARTMRSTATRNKPRLGINIPDLLGPIFGYQIEQKVK